MVFGQPEQERLQLNEVTVWSGGPQPNADRKDAYKSLPELRRLIREGQYDAAEKFANQNFNCAAPYNASYQTLGDLTFVFRLPSGAVTRYRRQLDIGQAVAAVEFSAGSITFRREAFASAPDGVLVQHMTADRSGALSFTLTLSRIERAQTRFVAPDTLVMTGDTGKALTYEVHVRVLSKGGRISGTDAGLTVEGADEVTLLLTAATTFVLDDEKDYTGGDLRLAGGRLKAASGKTYEALMAAHIRDYRQYFDRVRLDLGSTSSGATC